MRAACAASPGRVLPIYSPDEGKNDRVQIVAYATKTVPDDKLSVIDLKSSPPKAMSRSPS
jgi:hypothetical protein